MTWVLLSIAAAAFQTLRFALQRRLLSGALTALGATAARFVYAAPFAVALALGLVARAGGMPALGAEFWPAVAIGALAQVAATWAVVALFDLRAFAVGITFKKTEVVLTALVGMVVLGDRVSPGAMAAILGGLLGVLVLSDLGQMAGRGWARVFNRGAALGLASGAFFAVSAVAYRAATLAVEAPDPLLRAGLTLAAVLVVQVLTMALVMGWRAPAELRRVFSAWRAGLWIGLASLMGSLGWFTAFTLQNAAYVFAVGQVEVIFSIGVSVLAFGERLRGRELVGIALITASVVALVALA